MDAPNQAIAMRRLCEIPARYGSPRAMCVFHDEVFIATESGVVLKLLFLHESDTHYLAEVGP